LALLFIGRHARIPATGGEDVEKTIYRGFTEAFPITSGLKRTRHNSSGKQATPPSPPTSVTSDFWEVVTSSRREYEDKEQHSPTHPWVPSAPDGPVSNDASHCPGHLCPACFDRCQLDESPGADWQPCDSRTQAVGRTCAQLQVNRTATTSLPQQRDPTSKINIGMRSTHTHAGTCSPHRNDGCWEACTSEKPDPPSELNSSASCCGEFGASREVELKARPAPL